MKWKNSLIYRMTAIMAITMLLFSVVVLFYSVRIDKMKDDQFDHTIQQALDMNTQELMYDLENTESFLLTKCLDRGLIARLQSPQKEIDRFLAIQEIQELFHSSMNSYNMMDGLFCYDTENDIYIGDSKLSGNGDYVESVKENMKDYIAHFYEGAEENENSWFAQKIGSEYCLVKMYKIQNVYVGSWIHVNTMLAQMQPFIWKNQDRMYLLDGSGKVLSDADIQEKLDSAEDAIVIAGNTYKKMKAEKGSEQFSIVIFRKTEDALINIEYPILIAIGIILILCIAMKRMETYFLEKPINRLIQAMNELKGGNLETHLHEENVFSEFQVVNDTFDSMTKEIKKLKIDVYEEKLNKQQAELLYLQEQINPHFFTNCMNLIRNLVIIGESEKAQEATYLVSSHMRYALTNSTMIPLKNELSQVSNYVELQKMRFGELFCYSVKQEEGCGEIFVPTAVILNFVNNAIKHQLDPEHQLQIQVQICKEKERLHITICDSGSGFAPDVLLKLRRHEKLINRDGEHVGIYNVCQRLDILYGRQADICFFNRKEGGAVIELYLPFTVVQKEEKHAVTTMQSADTFLKEV